MITWHPKSCRRPDVYPAGDYCHCANCDTLVPLDQVVLDTTRFIPALPEIPAYEEIHFTWPESVQFWHDQDWTDSPHVKEPDIQGINTTGFLSFIKFGISLFKNLPPSSAAVGKKLRATEACQCYTKLDKIPRQIHSSAAKLGGVYKTLGSTDQIRLLLLSKGNFNDPVHGTLVIARLVSNIKFQALSYTWADAAEDDSRSEVIFLGPGWDIFMVTANCKAALRRLRRKDEDCIVWVDAICIDQGNHSERNHQVGLMRRIYSAASEVFVYLGEASSSGKEAFQRLMWAKEHEPIDEKGRQSLRDLFNMRYFNRIWVIQEIANAKSATMHCGDDAIGWSVLEEERLKTLAIHDDVPKWISSIYLRQEYTIRDLSDLLFSTTSSKASDPRDKVFALLGLINDAEKSGLVADYSLTLEEVQVGVSAFVIIHEDDCSILTYAGGVGDYSSSPARVPSWVPTWDRRYRSNLIPRGSKIFDSYVVLRAEHVVPHVLMLDDLTKPQIHHVGGYLSILALKMIDLSHLTSSWVNYLNKDNVGQISELFPGLALVFDQGFDKGLDEIVLLKGCETIFHVRKHIGEPSIFRILGVCNILLSVDRLNRNGSMNISELELVSHFILQNCPLERKHLQRMIELETLFKRLRRWDNESYPSTDITLCESMFLDSVITKALNIHIKELSLKLSLSETKSSYFKELGTGSQLSLPITLQVQWLTTRLRLWDSRPSWEIVNAFGDIYSRWPSWGALKAKLEGLLFTTLQGRMSLTYLEANTRDVIEELANLTISLASKLLLATGPSYTKGCRLRFGKLDLLLLRQTRSGAILSATVKNIIKAISKVLEKSYVDHFSKKRYLAGFQKKDDGSFEFADWDWSELETIFELLKPFHSSETRDLQDIRSDKKNIDYKHALIIMACVAPIVDFESEISTQSIKNEKAPSWSWMLTKEPSMDYKCTLAERFSLLDDEKNFKIKMRARRWWGWIRFDYWDNEKESGPSLGGLSYVALAQGAARIEEWDGVSVEVQLAETELTYGLLVEKKG